jgi:hypothetical protein
MVTPDPIEKAGILQHDIIRKLKPSEPGNQDLFRKTLKEKLEEDLEHKRKEQHDELVLGRQTQDDSSEEDQPEPEERAADAPDTAASDASKRAAVDEQSDHEPSDPTHLDVKA